MNALRLLPPNGLRYPLVGGTRQRHFDGTNFKPRKLPENAQTPTSRVHAVLAAVFIFATFFSLRFLNFENHFILIYYTFIVLLEKQTVEICNSLVVIFTLLWR